MAIKIDEKQIVLIIQICILLGVSIVLIIVICRPVYVPEVSKYEKLLRELGSTRITAQDLKIVERFKTDRENYFVTEKLVWNNDVDKFISVCDFATRILKVYNNYRNEDIYLLLVTDIINKIHQLVFKERKNEILKKENDYQAIVYLARLFNTFEYIADDKYKTTKSICHDLIIDLLPEFNYIRILGIWFNTENIIYTIIPRLLTHYLEPDKKNFIYDVKENKALTILEEKFSEIHSFADKREKIYLYDYHYVIYQIFKEKQQVGYLTKLFGI
ncbi:GSCOCT00005231001.2-RA-CDS [Cotesia congregata]|uniref:Cc_odve66_14 n=1 Tax=Cotesia congregata TaxID=51543 RepID=A0A8J2HMD9_COTCN|nr:GSCOCT00005231001.2-RA-CDS [Cotesia congregata]CAG5101836.1 Cc_odve66_14 [Cotesia congregata]